MPSAVEVVQVPGGINKIAWVGGRTLQRGGDIHVEVTSTPEVVVAPPVVTPVRRKPKREPLPEDTPPISGGEMRELRQRAKLSQYELGYAIGFSRGAVAEAERVNKLPNVRRAAGKYLNDLLGTTESPTR